MKTKFICISIIIILILAFSPILISCEPKGVPINYDTEIFYVLIDEGDERPRLHRISKNEFGENGEVYIHTMCCHNYMSLDLSRVIFYNEVPKYIESKYFTCSGN